MGEKPLHVGYRESARSCSAAFTVLANGGKPDLIPGSVILAGFAVECALKAYLATKLSNPNVLAHSPYGHDLDYLWRDAHAKGLQITPVPPDWCMELNALTTPPFEAPFAFASGPNSRRRAAIRRPASDRT
jgi:hypothetical protein